MIHSMTGYGDAEGQYNGVTYVVEIKTINSRYFKHRIKLPDSIAFLEEQIERILRQQFSRGTINCTISVKHAPVDFLIEVDESALKGYMEKLVRLDETLNLKATVDLGAMLNLPGVLVPFEPNAALAEKLTEKILQTLRRAVEQVKKMRSAEGAALADDLLAHCKGIAAELESIRTRSPEVIDQYRQRLHKRLDELMTEEEIKLDDMAVAREVAIFAERADISEEIARLESHIQQFTHSCRAGGQAGRKLDFISQEMLREANTIASKACDADIAKSVVEIKCLIDRIKEQAQNVE